MTMQMEDREFEKKRDNARTFGGGVYVGGVLAATALFISFVLTAFPSDAYFSRIIMTISALGVGTSMLAFPYALHNWIIEEKHRKVATALYYVEMAFISINTFVSFVTLLAKMTGYTPPQWAVLYEPFAILSVVYVVFAWGTIFNQDPESQRKRKKREYEETRRAIIEDIKLEYLKSEEGRLDIAREAQEEIMRGDAERKTKSFFGGAAKPGVLADHLFEKKQSTVEQPKSGETFRPG